MIECPVCGHISEHFLPVGKITVRPNAKCPSCGAYERHRLIGWYLIGQSMIAPNLRVLEIGPTPCLQSIIAKAGGEVVSIDLAERSGSICMDVEKMSFPDDSFDAVLCIHVLEHVTHDDLALKEIFRVLKPGGWAVLMVPIFENRPATDEDPSVIDPAERERRFGQSDHVRLYGSDYADRCIAAGFRMEIVNVMDPKVIARHGFLPGEKLYIGWKD